MMPRETIGLLCAGALYSLSSSAGAQGPSEAHASPRLVSASAALVPGTTNEVGISFTIEPGWHIYWDGYNDSGYPVSVTWTLPPGFKAGPIRWPAPTRHVLPGDILDHIYEGQVTLIVPLEVPESALGGASVTLSAELKWLECREVCLPGEKAVGLKLPIANKGGKPEPSKDAGLFEKARARVPRPIPKENPPVTLAWSGGRVEITAAGAAELLFYPGKECVRLADPIKEGQVKGSRMTLALGTDETSKANARRLQGVLEVRGASGATGATYYEIDSQNPQ